MQKHEECAIASSSSGLVVPGVRSVRAAHVTSTPSKAPLLGAVFPEPAVRLPCQMVAGVLLGAKAAKLRPWFTREEQSATDRRGCDPAGRCVAVLRCRLHLQ